MKRERREEIEEDEGRRKNAKRRDGKTWKNKNRGKVMYRDNEVRERWKKDLSKEKNER